jgi:acyl transferase domain-containing protein/NADPH:quinone reductase-like Zn-dependent oxidoreductase/acyl carrier protein
LNRSRHEFGSDPAQRLADAPIAIVGAACRLPGAPDLDAFRRLLLNGIDAVTEIPEDRWNKARLYHPARGQPGKAYTFAAGVLDDVKSFDAAFFGMSPREAVQADPQQRLALELAYEALEDAGLDVGALAGERVGVFVGGSAWDYTTLHSADPATMDAYSMTGATLCSLANRVSYMFDFRGPSFTVDTACSSSIVALHQACEAIRAGQLPMAMVGGLSLLLAPQSFVGFSAASMLSPRGRCHAFDHRADGYVRAEGGGFVVLKPLGEALAAGDPIRAVIRGTGVNSDGRTTGFSLPNKAAQMALLEEVYGRFELDPNDLIYLEAHGTGTPAGDPIEAGALGTILGLKRRAPLPIGSVKTNIGHLEAASGMAGLMKAIVVAEGGIIPLSLNLETPNPNIPFDALNLQLVAQAQPIAADGGGLIGINSFGFGGTNAHAVLERHPLPTIGLADDLPTSLPPLILSAQTEGALNALAATWVAKVDTVADDAPAELPRLIRSAARNRQQHKRRLVVPADDAETLAQALADHLQGKSGPAQSDTAVHGKLAFVFSGNGSQWPGMARDAIALSPAFREALVEVDAVLGPQLGWSVMTALEAPDPDGLRETAIAQPLLFAIQVALVGALRAAGVEADACMGHSVGEVAAAWAAGALDLSAASWVIAARSRAQQSRHGMGGMAVLGLPADASQAALDELGESGLEVAAHNSDGGTTIAGTTEGLDRLGAEAKAKSWRFTRLDLDYAFHSPIMDPIEAQLRESLAGLESEPSESRFVSTVTGGVLDGAGLDAGYWWQNVRQPVLFAEAARALVEDGFRIFVEIGPHPVVRAYLSEALRAADAEGRVIPTLQRRPAAHDPVKAVAARVHAAGADIRGSAAFFGEVSPRGLPRYPWARETFWLGRTAEAADTFIQPSEHPLLGIRQGTEAEEWRQHIGLDLQPWLADHVVGGSAVMPAAALLDMALAAAKARFPAAGAIELLEVEIGRALVLEPLVVRESVLRVDATGSFEIRSRPRLSDDGWTVHVKGRLTALDGAGLPLTCATPPRNGRFEAAALYGLAARMGLDYGPAFRGVAGVDLLGDDQAVAHLAPTGLIGSGFLVSPDLLDGALQGLLSLVAGRLGSTTGVMPWRFGAVRLFGVDDDVPTEAHLCLTRVGPRSVRADVQLRNASGVAVLELRGCWFVRVALGGQLASEDMIFHPASVLAAPIAGAVPAIDPAHLFDVSEDTAAEAALLADAYAAAVAAETLRPLADDDGRLDPSTLVRRGLIAEASLPIVQQLIGWLVEDDLAGRTDGGTVELRLADLPPSAVILQTLLSDAPGAVAEIALLAQAATTLPVVLCEGREDIPPPAAALEEQMRYAGPSGAAAIDALLTAVKRVIAAWPPDRPLRILEIGARRGGFTCPLVRTLGATPYTLVVLTDADDFPILSAMLDGVPGARAVAHEAELTGAFDLVIGLDALGALPQSIAGAPLLIAADPAPSRIDTMLGTDREATLPPQLRDVRETQLHGGLVVGRLLTARMANDSPAVAPCAPPLVVASPDNALATGLGGLLGVLPIGIGDSATLLGEPLALFVDDLGALPDRLALFAALARQAPAEGRRDVTLIAIGARNDPEVAALRGARRVLANEAPTLAVRLIRVDPGLADPLPLLAAELTGGSDEQEVALTSVGRCVERVRKGLPRAAEDREPMRLAIDRPGLLDSLGWEVISPSAPGPGQLAIEIRAAGLNFRDVMWAMGLLPDEALLDGFAGPTLGLECAGVVTAIGRDVAGFTIGDRVMAFAPASLSTHTVTAAHAVMRMPAGMDFAAAATVPVAFLTVAYAIGQLARLSAGETILIHGGAGGVGLAAIQYARHRGARVFATAGSPAKRALLESLGVEAVFDSRSLAFVDEVMALTEGDGVDVVLNSLAGEAMQRSLGLVKPFGRFLELGKRDFYENSAIGLRPFRHNVTYFGIDADQLPLKRPALAAEIFAEISALMASGALRALPYRRFDYDDVESAFRLMQGSGHIGKIVLAPGVVLPCASRPPAAFAVSGDGAFLVTGGLAGFGLESARWLARNGARKLALLGRRGAATPGADEVMAAFAADGVDARAYAVDVANEAALDAALARIRQELGPIRGLIHAAVAMDDALLGQLDADRFARALAPKLGGAEAFDRLTRADPIELFLLFSSVTTPMGNPGQANYVAANAAIEAVAARRHAEGLPGLAIQWGPIGDVGYLARETGVSEMLSRQLGAAHLTAERALDAIPTLLASGLPVAGFATVRWAALRRSLPLLGTPLFADMGLSAVSDTAEIDLRSLLANCSIEEARAHATEMLIEEVARIMKLAPERIEPQRPLTELGMDSLMAVELRLAVEQRFGVTVPVLALSEGATLTRMVSRILANLGGEETPRDETAQLMERLALHEGGSAAAEEPAEAADGDETPSYAVAAAAVP